MAVKKSQTENNVFYFFTITCYKWLPLFELTDFYDHIYKWFNLLKTKNVKTVSYVIMPNHLHSLVFFPDKKSENLKPENINESNEKTINQIIGTGKRFMAYEIVKRLLKKNRKDIMNILQSGVNNLERRRGKKHQVFQPSFDLKPIITKKLLIQKIKYIHKNPVSKNWHLVQDYREYKHSSAGFYEFENYSGYKIYHYLEV